MGILRAGFKRTIQISAMNLTNIGLLSLTAILLLQCKPDDDKTAMQKPNIIVILADDFGVGDIQSHYPDNKIPTPNLDKLVEEGMSFTDAHSSSAVCSPTRYSLLTGRYNWRTPLQEWVLACYEPPLIKQERTTLPEFLKEFDYSTACIGKWHLGWYWPGNQPSQRLEERNILKDSVWDFSQPILGGPTEHGFDYYFGTHVPNFPPFTYIENDHVFIEPTALYEKINYQGIHMPPSFDSMPMAPGWKFEDILPEITRRAVDYIRIHSREGKPFFLYFSMTSPHEPVSPSEDFKGKSGIAPIADFVMETDWSAGEILQAVEEAGIAKNTLVIFTADNGHSHYTGWEELVNAGHAPSGPFRGHKGDIWEGGHRIPFIASWEGKIAGGSSSDQLICLSDIYATCHELISGNAPSPDQGEDSFSFLNILLNKDNKSGRKNIVNHSVNGEFAYRENGWKIVFKLPESSLAESRGKAAMIELYHLEYDVAEQFDSAVFYPQKVKQLTEELSLVVERGTSREGEIRANDVEVSFDTIQKARWAAK
jgi:arylsulfatase A